MSSCDCETFCGPMVKRIAIPIGHFDDATAGATADVVLWLRNPSALLACLVAIVVQATRVPHNSLVLADTSVWQVFPAIPAGGELLEPQVLGPVFVTGAGVSAPRALPDAYAISDPTKLARINATIAGERTLFGGEESAVGLGTVYAVATWEPTDARMPRALWGALSGEAGLSIDGVPRRLSAVTV